MLRRLFMLAAALPVALCIATMALWGWTRSSGRMLQRAPSARELFVLSAMTDGLACVHLTCNSAMVLTNEPDDIGRWLYRSRVVGDREHMIPYEVDHQRLGFAAGRETWTFALLRDANEANQSSIPARLTREYIRFPYWSATALFAVMPVGGLAVRLRRRWRSNRQLSRGLCPACGYDLRATPDRCPECGAVPAKGAA